MEKPTKKQKLYCIVKLACSLVRPTSVRLREKFIVMYSPRKHIVYICSCESICRDIGNTVHICYCLVNTVTNIVHNCYCLVNTAISADSARFYIYVKLLSRPKSLRYYALFTLITHCLCSTTYASP